jgi:hypothetical protein
VYEQSQEPSHEIDPRHSLHVVYVLLAELLDAGLIGFERIDVDQDHAHRSQDYEQPVLPDECQGQAEQDARRAALGMPDNGIDPRGAAWIKGLVANGRKQGVSCRGTGERAIASISGQGLFGISC